MKLAHEMQARGIRGCGKIPHFIRYASKSLEEHWKTTVEDHLPEAISAARENRILGDHRLTTVLKDCIALHLVRSPRFLKIHNSSVMQAMVDVREEVVTQYQAELQREFRRAHGVVAAGGEALDMVVDRYIAPWRGYMDSGLLERQSVEETFERIRGTFSRLDLQILRVPAFREFVIADSPAFTYRFTSQGKLELWMAIGDSQGAAMPIARDCYAVVADEPLYQEVEPFFVDLLNYAQMRIAFRHVYYRPQSGLGKFVAGALKSPS
ncbi:uncharacterized protein DUF4238 [Actinokineospora auranticolor]|uniref:Uncharacterized protein DUF4238 n=2 Tax=Actinokineospora auranticolor TaxID=155976 RepID=A0A2S6GC47_9PSEU|nr:uncharacterized protein DUF4238 [Actinokineospora auranticolor]